MNKHSATDALAFWKESLKNAKTEEEKKFCLSRVTLLQAQLETLPSSSESFGIN